MMAENINYNYLDLLNPQQKAAVEYDGNAALVIAGAGSGKTRVLTYKIVHLLRMGYEPYRILALTFTNKAAREMKQRVCDIVGPRISSRLWMGTFHSIFLRILRQHADLIGFKPGFTIYDTADSRSLIKMIIKQLELDEKTYKPSTIASTISNAKNALLSPQQYHEQFYNDDRRAHRPLTSRIFALYTQRCKMANAMDFDDILVYMNTLLRDFPDLKRHYQEFFRYILVDEYQDTNFAQHLVESQLCGGGAHLCVVGDDAQSIYSFRGANISNILNLEKRYPGLRIFKLEQNYRSTQNIINAAGSLIDKNTRQMKKKVFSENEPGEPVSIIKTYSDMEEAYLVASMISKSQLTRHDSLDGYAVLYRTNAQSRVLEESLRKRNIPYRIYGGLSFYQRKEIKDITCYFRLAVNPDDDEALRRIINFPARGIGETTMKKIQTAASEEGCSIWSVLGKVAEGHIASINTGTAKKLIAFRDLINLFIADNEKGADAYELAQLIYNRTGILTSLAHDNTPESISRQENLSEMLSGLKDFVDTRTESGDGDVDMRAFLSEVMLATDQDETDDDNQPKVTLMTVHASKGLEFNHIFVVGVEEDLFPSSMANDTPAQVEEERRLLYVAMTRAKTTCTLTYAGSRFRNGQTMATRPSRFLADIDTRFLKVQTSKNVSSDSFVNPIANYASTRSYSFKRDKTAYRQSDSPLFVDHQSSQTGRYRDSSIDSSRNLKPVRQLLKQQTSSPSERDNSEIRVGSVIRHNRFGEGKIISMDHISGEPTISVDFGVLGIKKLIMRFARFDVLKF